MTVWSQILSTKRVARACSACLWIALVLLICCHPTYSTSIGSSKKDYLETLDRPAARWLLAASEPRQWSLNETRSCALYPSGTPSYGILAQLQSFLRRSGDAVHKPLFPLSGGTRSNVSHTCISTSSLCALRPSRDPTASLLPLDCLQGRR